MFRVERAWENHLHFTITFNSIGVPTRHTTHRIHRCSHEYPQTSQATPSPTLLVCLYTRPATRPRHAAPLVALLARLLPLAHDLNTTSSSALVATASAAANLCCRRPRTCSAGRPPTKSCQLPGQLPSLPRSPLLASPAATVAAAATTRPLKMAPRPPRPPRP